jgi:hypothetical protein
LQREVPSDRKQGDAAAADIRGETVILTSTDKSVIPKGFLKDARARVYVENYSSIYTMVAQGCGDGIILSSRHFRPPDGFVARSLNLRNSRYRNLNIFKYKHVRHNPLADAFIGMIRDVVNDKP